MKIIVTHTSPDWDAIGSLWLLKKFLPGWQEAHVEFVPAGQRYKNQESRVRQDLEGQARIRTSTGEQDDPIEIIGEDEIIHVDTGMGPLDHHQTSDKNVSAASRVWDYVRQVQNSKFKIQSEETERVQIQEEAISRIVKIIVDTDHFKEVFWADPAADYHAFSLLGVLDGLKLYKPDEDDYYVEFGFTCLESVTHHFTNRIWAENEIKEKGITFETRWGKGMGFETINDEVLKHAQKLGYIVVVRKDPRKGYVRIKARPTDEKTGEYDVDLTLVYEKLKKMDPDATWFLHVSGKMLLNGTPKNPKMVPTKLSLTDIIKVLESF